MTNNEKHIAVFLGGTCGENKWREGFIENLVSRGINRESLFNPIVEDWTPEDQEREDAAKSSAQHLLFYIGNPHPDNNEMSSYSMVEAVMALYDSPSRAVVVIDKSDLEGHQHKALCKIERDVRQRFGARPIFNTLDEAAELLAAELVG
jgi:hypothetical protein